MITQPSIVWIDPNSDIQAAIDALGAGGGTVHLRPGTYTLSTPLVMPENVTLQGSGENATFLSAYGVAGLINDTLITVQGSYCAINDLQLIGCAEPLPSISAPVGATQRGIVWASATPGGGLAELSMRNVYVKQMVTGCLIIGDDATAKYCILGRFYGCRFADNKFGNQTIVPLQIYSSCTAMSFYACLFERTTGGCVYLTGVRGVHFNECTIEGGGLDYSESVLVNSSTLITMRNCWFEDHAGDGEGTKYFIKNTGLVHSMIVESCHFVRNAANVAAVYALILEAVGVDYLGHPYTTRDLRMTNNHVWLMTVGVPVADSAVLLTHAKDEAWLSNNVTVGAVGTLTDDNTRVGWADGTGAGTIHVPTWS